MCGHPDKSVREGQPMGKCDDEIYNCYICGFWEEGEWKD